MVNDNKNPTTFQLYSLQVLAPVTELGILPSAESHSLNHLSFLHLQRGDRSLFGHSFICREGLQEIIQSQWIAGYIGFNSR